MMSSAAGPRAVVAGHAGFAAGIVSAVARISGRSDQFKAVSNEGLDARGVEEAIRAALKEHGASVVFTDLPAGSCTMGARRIARLDSSISIVTGATVAMLLDFALGGGATEADLRRAADKGREAVIVYPSSGGNGAS
jgi:PTS system N-acetylgalactosamine-specific IIA component